MTRRADELLLRALLDSDAPTAAAAGRSWLAQVDLQTIDWGQARLLPMLYRRLRDLGVGELPPLLRGTYRKAWMHNQLRFRAVAGALQEFESARIPHALLKGAALVPAYGGDWGQRDMSDIDVLVAADQLRPAMGVLEAEGWRPIEGLAPESVMARFADKRHGFPYTRPGGLDLDLHWHGFRWSRHPDADAPMLAAAVPLDIGSVRTRRFCDADLLLNVLDHARHAGTESRLQWVVDATLVLRSTPDPDALAGRLVERATANELAGDALSLLRVVDAVGHAPAAAHVIAALERRPAPRRRHLPRVLGDHCRGGAALGPALRSAAAEHVDGRLARRRAAWAFYVATGRRPGVERALRAVGGPLVRTLAPPTSARADGEGWLRLTDGAVVDALCGPGWSSPEPEAGGAWTEGREARLSLPCPTSRPVTVELEVSLLPARKGARRLAVREGGRTRARLDAGRDFELQRTQFTLPASNRRETVDLSLLITRPARPLDLGLGGDDRRLGVMLLGARVRPAP
jgi:hypothetical protein